MTLLEVETGDRLDYRGFPRRAVSADCLAGVLGYYGNPARRPLMKRILLLTPIALGGVLAARYLLTPDRRDSLSRLPATMMKQCMEHMPEDFPPKVMTSGMRRLQSQNDEILALLREQNKLLRRRAATTLRARQPAKKKRAPDPE